MNEDDLRDAVAENCCRDNAQKLSSKMALSVSEEMTQRTGELRCRQKEASDDVD